MVINEFLMKFSSSISFSINPIFEVINRFSGKYRFPQDRRQFQPQGNSILWNVLFQKLGRWEYQYPQHVKYRLYRAHDSL